MTPVRLSPAADARLDEIYAYTRETWGDAQAERYIRGLFDAFAAIARREVVWAPHPRRVRPGRLVPPATTAMSSTGCACPTGAVGVVTILHERMHQMDRFREDAGEA